MIDPQQQTLFDDSDVAKDEGADFGDTSFKGNKKEPLHRWTPWIAGFSSDFVAGIIRRELAETGTVLDPFCGVGTTLIEANERGHDSVGFDINPYAVFATRTKMGARTVNAETFENAIEGFTGFYLSRVKNGYEPKSEVPGGFNTRSEFYAPKVERKVLIYWDYLSTLEEETIRDLFRVAFAAKMISFSNYSYEPSLGTHKAAGRPRIEDHPVGETLAHQLREMLSDIRWLQRETRASETEGRVIEASFFDVQEHLKKASVDLAITSPPYLNNYHYIRNTRPHLYWMGFADSPKDYKPIEHGNYGKYWQTVRSEEEIVNLDFDNPPSDLMSLIDELRGLNKDRGIYGGNGWANYAAQYFNDTYKFGRGLMHSLRSGGKAYIAIGNSILQGLNFETDRHLASVCEVAGMEIEGIYTPRSARVGDSIIQSEVRVTAAKKGHQLYESVVELRRP